MRVLVSGTGGLVGSHLIPALEKDGHDIIRLVRHPPQDQSKEIYWDPSRGIAQGSLKSIDAVIHLAGRSIASGRWTNSVKREIRDSRVQGTRVLVEAMVNSEDRPKTLLCASAIGFYGDRDDEVLSESSPPGSGFLADVCREWEKESAAASAAGVRVCHLRFGMILSRDGGALGTMLKPFQLGLGGPAGSGRQFWSWIALDDVIAATRFLLATPSVSGPINLTSPNPVRNREFTKTLSSVLARPALIPLPGFLARTALGEMADDLLLTSLRVVPEKLLRAGFSFQLPELKPALEKLLR